MGAGRRGLGERPLRYRLYTMGTEQGVEWLSFSRTAGTLHEPHETHMVMLHCSTQRLEIYSTYVVVDNLDNPDDLKTVRVSMEIVVADVAASKYFSVVVDGRASARTGDSHQHQPGKAPPSRVERLLPGQSAEPASGMMISLGDIYYDTVYVNRSFAVENHSSMPLDFVLSHDKQRDAATEINFSLSNTALKVFSTLSSPHSSRRVFLHFRTAAARQRRGCRRRRRAGRRLRAGRRGRASSPARRRHTLRALVTACAHAGNAGGSGGAGAHPDRDLGDVPAGQGPLRASSCTRAATPPARPLAVGACLPTARPQHRRRRRRRRGGGRRRSMLSSSSSGGSGAIASATVDGGSGSASGVGVGSGGGGVGGRAAASGGGVLDALDTKRGGAAGLARRWRRRSRQRRCASRWRIRAAALRGALELRLLPRADRGGREEASSSRASARRTRSA